MSKIPRATGPYTAAINKNSNSKTATNAAIANTEPTDFAQNNEPANPNNQSKNVSVSQSADNNTDKVVVKEKTKEETYVLIDINDAKKLKIYSVVVGSFSAKENAVNLKESLKNEYNPIIVMNTSNMYRVLVASYNSYDTAKEMLKEISSRFPDSWILTQLR
jgi:cell division protein FtsN